MPTRKKRKNTPSPVAQNFPVVGIGASAGGLDAFKHLLKAIPEDSGMAWVLVQHLNPSYESSLSEILGKSTHIPVNEITGDIVLAPNHIYVIPPGRMLTTVDGMLKVTPLEKIKTNLVIDAFFISLAAVHEGNAIGVVLSGTGSDGTLGLKAIKSHGGITIAQDQSSADYGDMPQNAVNAGVVDFVLPPEKIPGQLLQINSTYLINPVQEQETLLTKDDETVFKQILSLLRQRRGVDFTYYKQNTVRRRIARRMALHQSKKLVDYLKFLRSDKGELEMLFQDMLIPVTSFFRDPKTFEALSDIVFRRLFKNRSANEPVRIWVTGCSTGEEAYSLAILIHEFSGQKIMARQVQIFASDISEIAIKKARTGIYTKADLHTISETRLENYFTKTDGGYQANKTIRDLCVFAVHNFLKDPPFAKIDLISCRNVLIYMDNFLQKKALTTFHYSLKEKGWLLLGKSETASAAPQLFTLFNKHDKIYTRKPGHSRFMHVATERREEVLTAQSKAGSKQETTPTDYRKSAEAILLSKYTPAGVIVNELMDVIHIHGTITPFLELSAGKPTFNLLKIAREGLGFELRNALHKAKTANASVIKEGIPSKINGKQHLVTIEVIPLNNTLEQRYLILFTKTATPSSHPAKAGKSKKDEAANLSIAQLKKELAQTREDMRGISEEQEAANEGLQSANEELQSSNEEMQSLNEELATSKEELQSSNEELTVLNQELIDKQEQVNHARLYAESIITTIREPLIILDKNLRIKFANTSFYKKFNLSENDTEGKIFYQIQGHRWDDLQLRSLLEEILPQKKIMDDFEITLTFFNIPRHLVLNARQIVSEKMDEQLILLVIEDVTDSVINKKLQESEIKFRTLSETIPNMVWTATPDGKSDYFNKFFLDYTGLSLDELRDDGWQKIISPLDLKKDLQEWKNALKTKDDFKNEKRIRHHSGEYRWHLSHAIAQKDSRGNISGWIGTNTEIEEQRRYTETIEKSQRQFQQMADLMPQIVWTARADGYVDYYNKRWYEYTGSDESYGDQSWIPIVHPDDVQRCIDTYYHSIKTGEPFQIEYRFKNRKNAGGFRWFLGRALPVRDDDGNILKWFGTCTDIHDQKIKEEEKDDFIGVASHELRTPITSLKGYVQLMENMFSSSDDQLSVQLLGKVDRQVNRLANLVKDLLDVTKIKENQLQLSETNFSIDGLINEVSNIIQAGAGSHIIITDLNARKNITADREKIEQVLTNLIVNAIKYSPQAQKIMVSSTATEKNVKVCVQDFGLGIDVEAQEKIFERFFRINNATMKSYPGLGLGLYISAEIIKRHGGTINVKSEIGKGSIFCFTIPLKN